jgi:preprotein translocase subunit SecB
MQAKKSPLILEKILIIGSNIVAIPIEDDFKGKINDFDLNIDFDIFSLKADADARKIVLSISGNDMDNPVPGYCFSIVAEGTFNYNKNVKTSKRDKDILLNHSAVPIMIGHVRSYLSTLTALGPYGCYLLPGIDMNDLLNNKNKNIHTENTSMF